MAMYAQLIASEASYIVSTQLRDAGPLMNGAIRLSDDAIVPVFANLAATALALSRAPGSLQSVTDYVRWYLHHLNWPDALGLFGTVYDYEYKDSGWQPKLTAPDPKDSTKMVPHYYDSADSYAATFMTLLRAYAYVGGGTALLEQFRHQIEVIAGVMISLMDQSDSLTITKPNYPVKFLMDNCEVNRGLLDAAWLFLHVFHDADKAEYFQRWARANREGILGSLGNDMEFYVSKDAGGRSAVNWKTWYADVTSQLFPVIFGVIPAADPRARHAYANMTCHHPSWHTFDKNPYPEFPWALVSYAAARMGEFHDMDKFKQSAEKVFIQAGHPWGWNAAEAGWLMLACRRADFVGAGW